ncbi:MAG TPA: AraC family transcriptional regulator [Ktedonobacteraceae bacterium]|nr:AraC family transcriptional regulator [Ktedonobacteraceae bacterium]
MDILTDVLQTLHLESSLYLRSELGAPWGLHVPAAPTMLFHAITAGSCWMYFLDGCEPVFLTGGDIIVLPQGEEHALVDDRATAVPPPNVPEATNKHCARLYLGGAGARSSIVCGSFHFHRNLSSFLLAPLPRLIHLSSEDWRTNSWLVATMQFLFEETGSDRPGTDLIRQHLTDILFVQILRTWIARQHEQVPGWLQALHDEHIHKAIAAIHEHPGAQWTVDLLAQEAGLGRASFAARFAQLVGEPPMHYLTRWRMQVAGEMLRIGSKSIDTIATELGYFSRASFTKAFKRHMGVGMGAYRRAVRGGVTEKRA